MIAIAPAVTPHSCAVAPSRISSIAWSSTKWLPPPIEPICESRPSVAPELAM